MVTLTREEDTTTIARILQFVNKSLGKLYWGAHYVCTRWMLPVTEINKRTPTGVWLRTIFADEIWCRPRTGRSSRHGGETSLLTDAIDALRLATDETPGKIVGPCRTRIGVNECIDDNSAIDTSQDAKTGL